MSRTVKRNAPGFVGKKPKNKPPYAEMDEPMEKPRKVRRKGVM